MKLYQHFKGGLYIVTDDMVLNVSNVDPPENQKRFVAYQAVNTGMGYIRPFEEFHETTVYKGKTGPRFRNITRSNDIMPGGGHP